jgi:hypothetical protein
VFHVGKRWSVLLQTMGTKHCNLQRAGGGESCRKLMPRYIGPFSIEKVVGKGAYKLTLPSTLNRIHNVFNVVLLKPYREDLFPGRSDPPPPILAEDGRGEMFFIDTILDHRVKSSGRTLLRQYLIKWKGFGSEHNSWEPEEAVNHTEFYTDYWEKRDMPPSLAQELLSKRQLKRDAKRGAR